MKRRFVQTSLSVLLMTGMSSLPAEGAAPQQETVLTATRTEQRVEEAAGVVTVITSDDIRKSGASTLSELLSVQPGVSVVSTGPLGGMTSVRLRGSTSQEVLILLDGVRLNSLDDGGFDLSALPVPLDAVERIEIVRGPASSLYGPDAVAGVVQIFTRKPSSMTTRFNAAYGDHGYSAYALDGTSSSGSSAYGLFANMEKSAGYRTNADLDKQNAGLSMKYAFDAASALELSLNYFEKDIGLPGPAIAPSPQARQIDRNELAWIAYTSRSSSGIQWKISATAKRNTLEFQDADLATSGSRQTDTDAMEAQFTSLIGSSNLITGGTEVREDKQSGTDTGDHSADLQSFYLQDELRIGSSLLIVVGDRIDKQSTYGEQWSPRLAGRYLFNSTGTTLRASYGESFRRPSFTDLYLPSSQRTADGITFNSQGNTGLVPETAKEYEAGIEQSLGGAGSLQATAFLRKNKNQILWQESQPDAVTYAVTPVNIDRSHVSGYEADAKFIMADTVSWRLNFVRTFPVDDTTGARIVSYAAPQPNMQAGCSLTMMLDQATSLGLSGRWVENYVKDGDARWTYYTVDGKLVETFISRQDLKVDFFIGMRNLFNRTYETVKGFPMPAQELSGGIVARF